jgi:hypothetical protein
LTSIQLSDIYRKYFHRVCQLLHWVNRFFWISGKTGFDFSRKTQTVESGRYDATRQRKFFRKFPKQGKTVSHFLLSSNLGYTKQLSKTSSIGIVELTRVERTTGLPEVCNENLAKNKFDSKSQFGLGIVVKITLNSFSKSHFSFLT